MCVKLAAAVLVVSPSPKFQYRFVMEPEEMSVNVTVIGTHPEAGETVKLAEGAAVLDSVNVIVDEFLY